MGRGDLQTTGRGNYRRLTQRLWQRGVQCPDFEADPGALEQPQWLALSAADYWVMRGLNRFADADDIETLTKRVNGGLNGFAHRQALYTALRTSLMKDWS
jgi:putative chitinase